MLQQCCLQQQFIMHKELNSYEVVSRYQLILDEFQNVTMIGYNFLQDHYEVAMIEYSNTPEKAKKPLKDIIQRRGPFKEFAQVKKITSEYSKVINVKGLLGTIRFLQGYYLLYIEQTQPAGNINEKPVFNISKVSILPLFRKFNDSTQADEQKHYQLLSTYEFQDLYFAYSYDLSSTLLQNINGQSSNQFVWNHYFKQQLQGIVGDHWIANIIHGYFIYHKNVSIKLSDGPVKCDLTVVTRRNRHQDGVRYLKRGINQFGYVANHVETQQIVSTVDGISSFLMVRGSVPVYWKQQPSFVNFQPKIEVMEYNSEYKPAQKHFCELVRRYGANIHCVNLLREEQSKPREGLLTNEFMKLIEIISSQQRKGIFYYEFDVKKQLKDFQGFQRQVVELSYYLMLQTGINLISKQLTTFQHGVARINCVDCLDRTNLFMSLLGEVAFIFQLKSLANQPIRISQLTIKQEFFEMYSAIHEELGNSVSIQYGGSEAHKHRTKINKSEILVSLKRHINNNTSDYIKQQQIDICHGIFSRSRPYIWESGYDRVEKPDSIRKNFNPREWVQQASTEYLFRIIKPDYTKVEDAKLEKLRDDFMKGSLPKKHVSLKDVDISWGIPFEYKSKQEQKSSQQEVTIDMIRQQIHKLKTDYHQDFDALNRATTLVEQLILKKMKNGGFKDKQLEEIEPFIRRLKNRKAI